MALVSTVLGFPLAALVAGNALAGPFEDTEAVYNAQNYEAALKGLDALARANNAKTQYLLGRMYAFGRAVAQNYPEALKLYRLAAAQAGSEARAQMWYVLSAALGNAIATSSRDSDTTKMTAAEIAQTETMAAKCRASNYKDCGS